MTTEQAVSRSQQGRTKTAVSLNLSAASFAAQWEHCNQLVDYLAKYAATEDSDARRGAMGFSSVFGEVVEAIGRHHARRGTIKVELSRHPTTIEVRIDVPVADADLRFYREVASLNAKPDLTLWYHEQVRNGAQDVDGALLGLAELAAVVRAGFKVDESPQEQSVRLTVIFPLSEMEAS